MNILFIGPLPDPVTGQALACQVFLEELLNKGYCVEVVDLCKKSLKDGVSSFGRIAEVVSSFYHVWLKKNQKDIIYLTISESWAGNIKDVIIYLICFKFLSNMIIHLHGGSIKKRIFERSKLFFYVNKFFISRMRGVIITGPSHKSIFSDIIAEQKIHIVPNCSDDDFFITEEDVHRKFSTLDPLNVLFLSNFIKEKGFNEIVDAFGNLGERLRKKVRIDFAGAFESDFQRDKFLSRIKEFPQIHYHGVVKGLKKKELLLCAHVFCLPTRMDEGQPVSILEAYASGCMVITTGNGGIPDIFCDGINGIKIEPFSVNSLKMALEYCILNSGQLKAVSLNNVRTAVKKYRRSIYSDSLAKIFNHFYVGLGGKELPHLAH